MKIVGIYDVLNDRMRNNAKKKIKSALILMLAHRAIAETFGGATTKVKRKIDALIRRCSRKMLDVMRACVCVWVSKHVDIPVHHTYADPASRRCKQV